VSDQAGSVECLYHGGKTLVEVLVPHPAHGVGPEKDRQTAVYASSHSNFAIPFALPIEGDGGSYAWKMSFDDGEPRITILSGYLDLSRVGYLYRVATEGFEPVDAYQWISRKPVVPLGYEIIDPHDYVQWIVDGEIR
jgi:hypothetical protein